MRNSQITPVVLFVYNRPEHTKRTLEAISRAELSDKTLLYIYADGPKKGANIAESSAIAEIRELIRSNQWCFEVQISESEENKGLRRSILNGVAEVVDRHGKAIVLEDDICISKGFLLFMNEVLSKYEDNENVMQIAGSVYDADLKRVGQDTFFARVMQCHGWATWKRAWDHYNDDALDHLTYFQSDPRRARDFDVDGSAYFLKQLLRNVTGEIDTWAVRWYASWLRAGGMTLFPKKSLVTNIGFDASGVHCGRSESYLAPAVESLDVARIEVEENTQAREEVAEFWRSHLSRPKSNSGPGIVRAMAHRITEPLVALATKISRRVLTRCFPDLKPMLHAQGKLSWAGVVSSTKGSRIAATAKLSDPVHMSWCIVGDHTYIGRDARMSYTEVGRFCSIGPGFKAGWGIHPTDGISTSPTFYSANPANHYKLCEESKFIERKKITIGNDVFIGMNVTVLDGVTIGDGSVIGAGCVVSKDVPPCAIVVGCPMKILRYRFDDDTRIKLMELKWWDWPEEKVQLIADQFFDVNGFVRQNGELK